MRAIPRFLAPSILKSSQRGKFAPEPYQQLSFSDRATIQALQAAGDTATVIAQKL
ncbi:helix-turn-helix domain-containing protein, partial [Lacticaseibacillus paracasei]|uniref:helix-turn-helix domain-containing protein n=1 Tax=Lacticaseibacillus paracasei TaxID=1597 RepID=UPI004045334E